MVLVRRFIPAAIGLLFNTGLRMSGYTNFWLAVSLWLLMVPLILYGLWPRLRRDAEIQQLKDELEEAGQENQRLEANLQKAEQERDELRQENEELMAESKGRADALPDTLGEWIKTTPLITVTNKTYHNERIELDGVHYADCTFINPTFSYKGEKPFRVINPRIEGPVT